MFLGLTQAFARQQNFFLESPRWHFVQKLNSNVEIDWTDGYLYASAEARLPRIDARSTQESTANSSRSLTEARAMARHKAHEIATARLIQASMHLGLDAQSNIHERIQHDEHLRVKMGSLSERIRVRSRRTGNGRVFVEMELPFLGREGLYALIAGERYNSDSVPEVHSQIRRVDKISSLIVDLSQIKGFRPALEPRIYTAQGRLIYGPELVSRTCSIRKGLVAWHTKTEMARSDKRAGQFPLYAYAGGLLGPRKSDLYLDDRDVEKLLSNAMGRKVLRRCAVIFIVSQTDQ